MKPILLCLALLLPLPALAGPITLLTCVLEDFRVQSLFVSSYGGRLFLITKPADGEAVSRVLPEEEWEKRILTIVETPTMKGVLYKDPQEGWLYTFKEKDGWYSHGNASCGE